MTPIDERDNFRDTRPREPALSAGAKVAVVLGILLVLGGVGYYYWQKQERPAVLPLPTASQAPAAPQGPAHPIPTPDKPLPALDASDDAVRSALNGVLPPGALERLVFEGFVRNVVATIDNLPRERYSSRLNPVMPVTGPVRATGRNDVLVLSPENGKRYAPAIAALEGVDAAALGDFYRRHYPLFQQAYTELGYPDGYFNDRLVEVIDHLLAAPDVKGPIRLVQPKVLYEFADPELESLSAGRKVMVRIGPENAARAKESLRQIRAQVAR